MEKTSNTGLEYLPYKFTCKEIDEETGLYYYGARYLDPRYSRWISTDPALVEYATGSSKGEGGIYNSVNLNLYHYAGNNPVKYKDPDGKIIETVWDIGFTAVDVGIAIYKSTKGDNSGWIDVGIDAAAIIIPDVPAGLSKIDDAVKIAKNADKVGNATKVINKVSGGTKTVDHTVDSARILKNARQSAVKKAWKQEQKMVESTGQGTRNWSKSELKELKETGKVKGYQGHHINNVKDHPSMAGDPNNIEFLNSTEHLQAHGGNYKNPTEGNLINRNTEQ